MSSACRRRSRDRREERKGPRVGAPEGADPGLSQERGPRAHRGREDRLRRQEGRVLCRGDREAGPRDARADRRDLLPPILRSFPWPKSMRWGAASARADSLRWVRPLRSILCTFGVPHETPEIDRVRARRAAAGDVTYGHRFLAPAPIKVRRFDDYVDALAKAKVVLDADRRKEIILADARNLAFAHGLELVEDEGLLEEVAGLVEWPVVLMGEFEAEFLEIPPEVIRATIRANQKCFVLRDARRQARQQIHPGRQSRSPATAARRSRRATRASCARGFRTRAISGAPILRRCRTTRTRPTSRSISGSPNCRRSASCFTRSWARRASASSASRLWRANWRRWSAPMPDLAERAARLAKADLVTEMVGEFPELQGLMGRYYAAAQGEDASRRRGDRGALQAAGAERSRSDRAGFDRRRARRQARHARRILGDRRKADGEQGPLRAAPGGARGHPHCAGEFVCAAPLLSMRWMRRRRAPVCQSTLASGVVRSTVGHSVRRASDFWRCPRRRRPPRLLRRPAQSLSARQGRPARSHRRGVRPSRPGRSLDDRPPRRGARPVSRDRRRQEPARRLSPRRQHFEGRGEEGRRGRVRRRLRSRAFSFLPEEKALAEALAEARRGSAAKQVARGRFRGRDARARAACGRRSTPSSSPSPSMPKIPRCASTACGCSARCAKRCTGRGFSKIAG